MIDMRLAAIRDRYAVQVKGILKPRHPRDEEFLAVWAPERSSEILVIVFIEVRPDYFRNPTVFHPVKINHSNTNPWIDLSSFRIAGFLERAAHGQVGDFRSGCTVIRLCRINREKRCFRVVKTVEADFAAVRRPPECTIF